jgi:hypothetical protein
MPNRPAANNQGPKKPENVPPILSVYRNGSNYIMRIYSRADIRLAASLTNSLTDADSLLVITPDDTKLFQLRPIDASQPGVPGQRDQRSPAQRQFGTFPAPDPDQDEGEEGEGDQQVQDEDDPQMTALRLAGEDETGELEQGGAMGGEGDDENDAPSPRGRSKVRPAGGMRAVRRERKDNPLRGSNSVCGRCRGVGQVQVALEGGASGTATCPVCQGEGEIRRYGASPSRR